MKKLTLCISFVCFTYFVLSLSSCDVKRSSNNSVEPDSAEVDLEALDSDIKGGYTNMEKFYVDFMSRHKNGLDNDYLRKKMNSEFKQEVIDSFKTSSNLLLNFPLELESLKSNYKNKNTCLVHFSSWLKPDEFKFQNYDLSHIAFDIVGTAPIKYAETLKEDSYYFVFGKFKRFISLNEFRQYTDHMAYTNQIGIDTDGITHYKDVQIGLMLFDIDSIVNTNYRKRY